MNNWKRDKAWSDRFLPEIKRILGEHLIAEPPIEEDAERNTDLMVLKLDAIRVACRVRENRWLRSFGHEFTIREGRPSGAKTELAKIIEGWGDYLFYGFSDEHERHLEKWFLGDLKVFRAWFMRETAKNGKIPGNQNHNGDGSSWFRAYERDAVLGDAPFIVADSERQEALF